MTNKQRIANAFQYAIDSSYQIHQRQIDVQRSLYAHKNVCIFGVGKWFEDCGTEEYMRRFEYVCDNNRQKWGQMYRGRKCISPRELTELEDVGVLIMVRDWQEIYEQLSQGGIDCYPFEWYVLNVYDKHYDSEWFNREKTNALNTYDLFEDEISKMIYTEAICNRIAPQFAAKQFRELQTDGEYFYTDVYQVTDQEYVVDAGAYIGDSIKSLLTYTNRKCGTIYSFELNSRNYAKLEENVKCYRDVPIELFNVGLGADNEIVTYKQRAEKIVSLDSALKGKKVTLIKMDIETYEKPALDGAAHIIQTQHPKLAISAYHYLSDLWDVPNKIKQLGANYKLYLRHHSPAVWDTDCYAVWCE